MTVMTKLELTIISVAIVRDGCKDAPQCKIVMVCQRYYHLVLITPQTTLHGDNAPRG
jgi:hypothetical protein